MQLGIQKLIDSDGVKFTSETHQRLKLYTTNLFQFNSLMLSVNALVLSCIP